MERGSFDRLALPRASIRKLSRQSKKSKLGLRLHPPNGGHAMQVFARRGLQVVWLGLPSTVGERFAGLRLLVFNGYFRGAARLPISGIIIL